MAKSYQVYDLFGELAEATAFSGTPIANGFKTEAINTLRLELNEGIIDLCFGAQEAEEIADQLIHWMDIRGWHDELARLGTKIDARLGRLPFPDYKPRAIVEIRRDY